MREAQNRTWAYDHHNYKREDQIKDIAEVEKKLNQVFAWIVFSLSPKDLNSGDVT